MSATPTVDPTSLSQASQIPPAHADHINPSPRGWVDVYCGTLPGDVDAAPSAQELLASEPDTGGLSNADYVYSQIAALYGTDLPTLHSPSGRDVRALVFVSGSDTGAYGAFHFPSQHGNSQSAVLDLDRIVVDSLESSGSYAQSSGLSASTGEARLAGRALRSGTGPHFQVFRSGTGPHFQVFRSGTGPHLGRGPHAIELFDVLDADDPRLAKASSEQIRNALRIVAQSIVALKAALETKSLSAPLRGKYAQRPEVSDAELAKELVAANQEVRGLLHAVAGATGSRHYLSTALFAAELTESFERLQGTAAPGKTDGEAVSRVVACKLAPEISLIPEFSGAVAQLWWQHGQKDYVNHNSASDTDTDANGAGVMFLLFLTDYLGVPLDQLIRRMPTGGTGEGTPLGKTYAALLGDFPQLRSIAGDTGASAFAKMIELLRQHALAADGTLSLPADGNPFPHIPGAQQGGLFASSARSGVDER